MARRIERDDRSIPIRCTDCAKRVLDGNGNQEMLKSRISRYCDKCWKKHCEHPARAR